MNSELKALLQALFDVISVVEDAVVKKDFVTDLLPKLYKVAADIPAIVSSWSDLMPELQKLTGVDADADLAAFVISQVPGVASDAHAQKIIAASLDLALSVGSKSVALAAAIKG